MSKNKIFLSVKIFDLGSKGQSIAKSDEGIVLMVKNGVPGDVVDIKTLQKEKKLFFRKYYKIPLIFKKQD